MFHHLLRPRAVGRDRAGAHNRRPSRRGGRLRNRRKRRAAMSSPAPSSSVWLVEVIEVGLAEGAVVEPVVAHPSVHHGAFGRRHFQRRMRAEQRHDHGEAFIGRADHAHAAVRFRGVLHQPVDGVVGVGDVVGSSRCSAGRAPGASSRNRLPSRTCRAHPGRRGCSRRRRTPRRPAAGWPACAGCRLRAARLEAL